MKIKIGKFPKKGNRRKINVQIDAWDTWSMDHTLALIVYPMLLQLKATKHGVPSNFCEVGGEDYVDQDSFDFYKETYNDSFNEKVKLWDEVLDKMIWAFKQIAFEDYEAKYHHGKSEWDFVKSDHTFPNPITGKLEPTYQMVDRDPNSHWFDIDGQMLHEERIQEGLNLFGKYYRNLWD